MAENNITYSSSIEIVDPGTLFPDGYELSNQNVIQSEEFVGSFIPEVNIMEFYIYDANKQIIHSDYNFEGYYVEQNSRPSSSFNIKTQQTEVLTDSVNLNPENDIAIQGFTNGNLYAVYNFINLELGSSLSIPYYLAEISSDRTEIRLKSNKISTKEMKSSFVSLNTRLNTPSYFDEIYISFGNNDYHIGVNMKYDDTLISPKGEKVSRVKANNAVGQSSILIKLYDALPTKFNLLDELYVCTKTAETQAYLVNYLNDFVGNNVDNIISLRGPNSNLKINEFVNGSTTFQSKKELLGTKSSGSKDQLLNRLAQDGVTLNINYATSSFNDYVNFSSAKSRVSNFVEKVSRIQAYEADIATVTKATGSNPGVPQISESLATLYTKIQNEITAFDGFDYYQYYSSASDAYPKSGTVFPLQLQPTQSSIAQNWITATETSASRYDEDNQNWLYYTIPDFIKENSSNANYLEFVNMIGQSFDEMWLYTKAIAEKNNTTNAFDKGVSLQLADDVITSLGYTGFGNNYNNQNNFIGLIGNDDGNYLPPTGSELITQYIAVNGPGGVANYWADYYSYEDYVEQLVSSGFPYPIDKVSKEIFKRLYHNMAYLVKKKGTISGLRQLINIWGIPSTILRINEFGGKNKDEEDDYDLWYKRFSYAFKPVPIETHYASASFRAPWQPLYRNYNYANNQLSSTSTITAAGTNLTGGNNSVTSAAYGIDSSFTVTGGGSGGTLTLTTNGSGVIITATLTQGDSGGYSTDTVITITAAQVNALSDGTIGSSFAGGAATFTILAANLNTILAGGSQGNIVPDGLGFRFKTTGYPSSSYAGLFNTQSLFIKKSTADGAGANVVADLGIVLYYTGSMSGSGAGNTGPTYDGGNSSAYKDYGEMRFLISGSAPQGGTAISQPIYLPFFDKGWWNVQLQRDQHPSASQNDLVTTYTLYAANKIYDGADGNQIGFTGSVSLTIPAASASVNESWNNFTATNIAAGGYLGGWGDTLATGLTGSIGTTTAIGGRLADSNIAIGLSGKNFSGSLQEFRYYSHDISQSVFNDAVMNPESIEGNHITGSESSFDIVNFRAPLGNELENLFTSSQTTAYIDTLTSVHPAITGSSPLTITGSFINPTDDSVTSSYDISYNTNTATRTYSETNTETYFLDQPSIGVRNRISNKIKYSTNLNFGNVLSNKVSIQQDPPISQSYTDNINLLEVAFSPTDEVNDDIIQALGYGAIQEVIADPRFRSSSDDNYPGLQAIAKDYFKKYYTSNTFDYLRLIQYFDDSLFRAIKNYVPARTSVSTGIVIKQNMLERSRYREPQVDIVTTQSYAPFNQPLTAKNLELTGSVTTYQLWNPAIQNTYYSSSDIVQIYGGPGGSVNQYNILEEGGGLYILESDQLDLTGGAAAVSLLESKPLEEANNDIVYVNAGIIQAQGTATIKFNSVGVTAPIETTTTGNADANHSIVIETINPSDGATVTINYCSSDNAIAGIVEGNYVTFYGNTTSAATKATSFAEAVNSTSGQGSGAATPTLTAVVDPGDSTAVILTQLYGGTAGNTTITYGSSLILVGPANTLGISRGGTYPGTGGITDNGTGAASISGQSDLKVSGTILYTLSTLTIATNAGTLYAVGDTFQIPSLLAFSPSVTSRGEVTSTTNSVLVGPTIFSYAVEFTGGTSAFSNTFLNALKSVQTPVYVDYDFAAGTFINPTAITLQASSSKRGVVMTNTTSYTTQNPAGSILSDSLFDIHPGEDMYVLISSDEDIDITDYQLILGENIIITTALASQTTAGSYYLTLDNFSDDNTPVVGSVVTGPDVKAGEVTVLGAITEAGTGYTNGAAQVLATTGAGANNLTLTVTVVGGSLTTAALSNIGTGYTSGDIVTVIGGNNDAKVAITTATAQPVTVALFGPTTDIVQFNIEQTINENSKLTFTATAIPDADTIPVSQQGYFTYNTTSLGIDTSWDGYQEQFYDGEYSGSNFSSHEVQYNPYRKVKPNSTGSIYELQPAFAPSATYVSESRSGGAPSGVWTSLSETGFHYDNTATLDTQTLNFVISASIIPGQEYEVTFKIVQSAGTKESKLAPSSILYDDDGTAFRTYNGTTWGTTNQVADNIFGIEGTGTRYFTGSFIGRNNNLSINYQDNNRWVPLSWSCKEGVVGDLSEFQIRGIGGEYAKVRAEIFLTQQDEGYNNQADYQNMTASVNNIHIDPIWLIENTQSIVFESSDYNPLSNNVNINRSSSHRYILSYGATQSVPNNFDQVVTQSYNPTSPSGSFPERADVPDSNYTMPSSINARYNGTKLRSLNYNHFTPSGSVGSEVELPISPVNIEQNIGTNRVALQFLDGSVTSSFIQTGFGAGSASWSGDDNVPSGSTVIDKHPIYMARFENSYEQLGLYNSYQYNIDQLIQVPFEDIAGKEITPNSITIDGSNQNKKFVSSIFEPNRKALISYLNPKTSTIDYTTMQIGNYDILGGAVEFISLNSNAKSRVSASLAYQYTLGNTPSTGSRAQSQGQVQMITGSNTIADPQFEGMLTGTLTLFGTAPTISTTGTITFTNVPLDSVGSQGSGAQCTLVFTTYVFTSATITTAGQGYSIGDVLQINQATINDFLSNTKTGGTATGPINFIIEAGNITANPTNIVSYGFLLSGSLTTDVGQGAARGKVGSDITGTTAAASANGQYNYLPVSTSGSGVGMFVNLTIAAGNISLMSISTSGSGGKGYQVGDIVTILETTQTQFDFALGTPGDYDSGALTADDLTGGNTPFLLNYNPSPISASTNSSFLTAPTVPENQQLLVGGPQLAVYHAYNTTVSSSLYATNPKQINSTPDEGPFTLLWTTSGSSPSNPENYYNWNPNGSDCASYQNPNTAFLIERGDIIRVEGVLNQITNNFSQSTNVIEDFTVEEVQSYYYTSSFADSAQDRNALTGTFTFVDNNPGANVYDPGCCSTAAIQTFTGIIGSTSGVTSGTGNATGATVSIITSAGGGSPTCPGWVSITLAGGHGFLLGERIDISKAAIDLTTNWSGVGTTGTTAAIRLRVLTSNLANADFNNDFTFGVDVSGSNSTESGSVTGYHLYEEGEVGFTAPTFIRVTPDPTTALSGLIDGEVTKFTVRRQIEADDKVMLKKVIPPSGSRGVDTPSGQGFLIPNDFSPQQKSNALNIINQLKAKNAFDKPNEPGITDIGSGGSSSGNSFGGGGEGGIQ